MFVGRGAAGSKAFDLSLHTVFRGEGLTLHVQDERVANAGALRKFFGLDSDPPILPSGFVAGEVLIEGGVASAHDFTQQTFNSPQKIRLVGVFHIFRRQISLVVDIQYDDLKILFALESILLNF